MASSARPDHRPFDSRRGLREARSAIHLPSAEKIPRADASPLCARDSIRHRLSRIAAGSGASRAAAAEGAPGRRHRRCEWGFAGEVRTEGGGGCGPRLGVSKETRAVSRCTRLPLLLIARSHGIICSAFGNACWSMVRSLCSKASAVQVYASGKG
jgi:hypothetical protein